MAKKPERQKVFVKARHEFSQTEWKEATQELTRTWEIIGEREASLKALQKQKKAEIEELKTKFNELNNAVRNGGVEKDTKATVEFKTKAGKKVYRFDCPGEPNHEKVIREEPMSQSDFEGLLPLEDEPTPPEKSKGKDKPEGKDESEPDDGIADHLNGE